MKIIWRAGFVEKFNIFASRRVVESTKKGLGHRGYESVLQAPLLHDSVETSEIVVARPCTVLREFSKGTIHGWTRAARDADAVEQELRAVQRGARLAL
ncbi:MAG: hypothetical protein ACLP59_23900 [Bryobacteraceae bacterium]